MVQSTAAAGWCWADGDAGALSLKDDAKTIILCLPAPVFSKEVKAESDTVTNSFILFPVRNVGSLKYANY